MFKCFTFPLFFFSFFLSRKITTICPHQLQKLVFHSIGRRFLVIETNTKNKKGKPTKVLFLTHSSLRRFHPSSILFFSELSFPLLHRAKKKSTYAFMHTSMASFYASLSSRASVSLSRSTTTAAALRTNRRTYYWPYPDDFVPAGGPSPSSFQSSAVPSRRMEVVKALALGPLHGERRVVCRLGWNFDVPPPPSDSPSGRPHSIRSLMACRPAIRQCLAHFFHTDSDNVILSSLQQTKKMMLFRGGLPQSPRLADGPGALPFSLDGSTMAPPTRGATSSSPPNKGNEGDSSSSSSSSSFSNHTSSSKMVVRTFLHSPPILLHSPTSSSSTAKGRMLSYGLGYARSPVAAKVLLEVELAPSPHITPTVALEYGRLLQEYFFDARGATPASRLPLLEEEPVQRAKSTRDEKEGEDREAASMRRSNTEDTKEEMRQKPEVEDDNEDGDVERCRKAATLLREAFGVCYCEVPPTPDASDYSFQQFWEA